MSAKVRRGIAKASQKSITTAGARLIGEPVRLNEQLMYAGDLLAELLNRAYVLYRGPWWIAHEECPVYRDPPSGDAVEALMELKHAAEIFLNDCEEIRIRARRARLVAAADLDGNYVDAVNREPDDLLATIGGEFDWVRDPQKYRGVRAANPVADA